MRYKDDLDWITGMIVAILGLIVIAVAICWFCFGENKPTPNDTRSSQWVEYNKTKYNL
jgi:hypothetical protein